MERSTGADRVAGADVSETLEAYCLIRSMSAAVNTRQLFRSRSTSFTFPLISHLLRVTADTPMACAAWLTFISWSSSCESDTDPYQPVSCHKNGRREHFSCTNPDMPVLFVSGAEDPCLINVRHFAKTVRAMRRAGYKDVKGKLYPGMRHEILNEIGREQVYHDIAVYMRKKGF